jgi:hypothetical protein
MNKKHQNISDFENMKSESNLWKFSNNIYVGYKINLSKKTQLQNIRSVNDWHVGL